MNTEFLNVKNTAIAIRSLGLSVRRTDGEWRVAFPGVNQEASAYYTTDNEDALNTARCMVETANAVKEMPPAKPVLRSHIGRAYAQMFRTSTLAEIIQGARDAASLCIASDYEHAAADAAIYTSAADALELIATAPRPE